MGRVLKKKHRRKGEKQVIRHRKSEIFPGHNPTLPKDQKKLLTNARLTVPHVQTGIFMKGRKSSTYHREEDVRFNVLNKARMDEKLNDILNLAKHSRISNYKLIHESPDTIHDVQTHLFSQGKEQWVNSSHSMILEERCEKKKYQVSQSLPKDISSPKEIKNQTKQNIFQCRNLQSSEKHYENFHELDYSNFKLFVSRFDHLSFNLAFTEDFIVQEKLALKRKKKNKLMDHKSINKSSKINKEERTTTGHSQNSEGEDLMDETEMLKNINCRNMNKTLKLPKKNLNYNAFKNVKKIQIINTSHGQQKNPEFLENMDIFPERSSSQSSHHEFELNTTEKIFSSEDEITFSDKSSLLNPLSFLENSLSENNNYSMPSTSKSSSLDGFQFLKHSLGSSSSSAPPDLHVTKHRTKKQFSQPCISLNENATKKRNEKFESPTIKQHSPSSLNIWKNDIKFNLSESPRNHEFFDLQSGKEMKTQPHDFQIGNYFTNDKVASKDLSDNEDCISCTSVSQLQTFENLSPFLGNINYSSSPIYTQKVTKPLKLESPVLKTAVKCHDIQRPCCLHFSDDNYLASQTMENDIPSISHFEEEDLRANNFWHRRKMF